MNLFHSLATDEINK